jgi:hypothetical protein
MEKLAWLHHELGEYNSARDVRVTVLEKYQILRGGRQPIYSAGFGLFRESTYCTGLV